MVEPPEPTRRAEPIWLEPYPDMLLEGIADAAPGPAARYETRESVGLAFMAALQLLPPRQRAALVLRDVLGFRTAEVAEMLDSSEASVKGALQRARATLDERLPAGGRRARAAAALRNANASSSPASPPRSRAATPTSVVALLTDDAWLTMPPEPYEYQGREAIARVPARPRRPVAARSSGSCPPAPTASPPSAATCPTRRRRSRAPTA